MIARVVEMILVAVVGMVAVSTIGGGSTYDGAILFLLLNVGAHQVK